MKIRNGFVSNSSSSSFLLLYKEYISGTESVLARLKQWTEDDPVMYITMGTECDGLIFEVIDSDKAKKKFLAAEDYWRSLTEYDLQAYLGRGIEDMDYNDYTITQKDIGYKLYSFWMDYYSLLHYNEFNIKEFYNRFDCSDFKEDK